jgi:hypothetical protein
MVTAGKLLMNWQISLVTVRTRQGGCFGSLLYSLVADPRSLTLVVAGINEAVVAVRYSRPPIVKILATMDTTGINDDTRSSSGHQTNAT